VITVLHRQIHSFSNATFLSPKQKRELTTIIQQNIATVNLYWYHRARGFDWDDDDERSIRGLEAVLSRTPRRAVAREQIRAVLNQQARQRRTGSSISSSSLRGYHNLIYLQEKQPYFESGPGSKNYYGEYELRRVATECSRDSVRRAAGIGKNDALACALSRTDDSSERSSCCSSSTPVPTADPAATASSNRAVVASKNSYPWRKQLANILATY